MPPETPPPDDARGSSSSSSEGGNVVDPAVLAERRAQRAEQAEQSAARRAADAQVLAAQLARERARLEAERDAARAEAAAAREGADAAIAEARHLQAERDSVRDALIEARRERDQLAATAAAPGESVGPAGPAAPAPAESAEPAAPRSEPAQPTEPGADAPAAGGGPATANGTGRNGHAVLPPAWAAGLRRELAVARSAAAVAAPPAPSRGASPVVPGLARERRIVAQRAAAGPVPAATPTSGVEGQRRGDRAAPITALALERERSSRLQAQLDSSLAVQRELRTHIAALQRAVHQRVEAERRIEAALRRVREELTAANAFAAGRAVAPAAPGHGRPDPAQPGDAAAAPPGEPPRAGAGSAAPAATPMPPASSVASPPTASSPPPARVSPESSPEAEAPAVEVAPAAHAAPPTPALDPLRLSAAHERLRASVPPAEAAPQPAPPPAGPPAPWLTEALQRLLASDPETAGRIAVGVLPAHSLAAEKPLRLDLLLTGRGCLAIDVAPNAPA
ncbi:MAG TPA: hypothetical protein VFS37_11960, partial [Conexibacter sp.]|nr:hypothetical protein [Conexibacter sp.]